MTVLKTLREKSMHDTNGSCDICADSFVKGQQVRMFLAWDGYDEYENIQTAEFYCMKHTLREGWRQIRGRSDRAKKNATYCGCVVLI